MQRSKRKTIQAFPLSGPHAHLLKACLAQDRGTLQLNLDKWKAGQDIHLVDLGAYKLLPLLQKQLTDFQVQDNNLSIYKGIYRKSWMNNNLLFHKLVKLSDILRSRGIPVLVLKGVPLSVLYYKDNGIRPMDDADICVPADKLAETLAVFKDQGWYSRYNVSDEAVLKYRKYFYHAIDFKNDDELYIDLHWKPIDLPSSLVIDNEIWRDIKPLMINGAELQTLSAEFHFFHAIVHGVRWNAHSSVRWIVDSIMILRAAGAQFDWEKLLRYAEKYHSVVFVKEASAYLADEHNAPVPGWVFNKLALMPVGAAERAEFKTLNHQNVLVNDAYYKLWAYYTKLRTVSNEWSTLPFVKGYLKYLRLRLESENVWGTLTEVPKRTIRFFTTKMKSVKVKGIRH
jgi:hypothetical protein